MNMTILDCVSGQYSLDQIRLGLVIVLDVSMTNFRPGGKLRSHLVPLGYDLHNLWFNGKRAQATWCTIYVVPSSPNGEAPRATITRLTISCYPQQSFRLPHWLVSRFLALVFTVYEEKWDKQGVQVIRFRFFHLRRSENLVFDLGL